MSDFRDFKKSMRMNFLASEQIDFVLFSSFGFIDFVQCDVRFLFGSLKLFNGSKPFCVFVRSQVSVTNKAR